MRLCLVLIGALTALGSPAIADERCDDLWFTRNLIFDRAGYCFGSPLGQAVFGNEGCTTSEPVLGGDDQYVVAEAGWKEAEWNCAVDTGRAALTISGLDLRRQIRDLPLISEFESACIGWRGGRLPLRAARDQIAQLTGAARDGETLLFRFDDRRGWSFVEVMRGEVLIGAGWTQAEIGEDSCEAIAG